jgi:hypothetical protein
MLETCTLKKKMPMIPNPAVLYQPEEGRILVCKNYIRSKQLLKEELRRENTIAFDHLI